LKLIGNVKTVVKEEYEIRSKYAERKNKAVNEMHLKRELKESRISLERGRRF